jgi:hypothetical protein
MTACYFYDHLISLDMHVLLLNTDFSTVIFTLMQFALRQRSPFIAS